MDVSFESGGETCAAWHLAGDGDDLAGPNGRPCVVMAPMLGGTRDSGLLPFAEAFAAAGFEVLLFDYRCFGDSSGEPRQFASPPRHRKDYVAAVACARGLEGVDPDRIVLWGTSWSGGHVAHVASNDPSIAAVISQNPDLDGLRTLWMIAGYGGVGQLAKVTWHGLRDRARALRGASPHLIPLVGPPGSVGAMTSEDSEPGYHAIAGPRWRNELTARAVLEETRNRAITRAGRVSCPGDPGVARGFGGRAICLHRRRRPCPACGADQLPDRPLRHLPRRGEGARDRGPTRLPRAGPLGG